MYRGVNWKMDVSLTYIIYELCTKLHPILTLVQLSTNSRWHFVNINFHN